MAVPTSPSPVQHGVLFDVGYGLLDESSRLHAALGWLSTYLERHGVRASPARLHELYLAACRAPALGPGGLLVQTALAAGADATLAQQQRREMPWDAVPMPPLPGAREALATLRGAGLRVGVLANQPASARLDLERAGLLALLDDVWLSEAVGLAKPDPQFFRLALRAWDLPAARVAYVGDRPDNDVAPAKGLGLHAVRLLLGPHAAQPERGPQERPHFAAASLQQVAVHLCAWAREGRVA